MPLNQFQYNINTDLDKVYQDFQTYLHPKGKCAFFPPRNKQQGGTKDEMLRGTCNQM